MKLLEILDKAKNTGDIIIRKNKKRGCVSALKYFEEYKEFMAVSSYRGNLILPDNISKCKITLTEDLLNDDFYLSPIDNKISPFKIKKHYVSIYKGNGKTNNSCDYKEIEDINATNDQIEEKINEIINYINMNI
jgi:hypothetical protein